ncbi:MAG TPA: thioredoxin family protein [Mesorhizobium sp.]|jgi:hypothetical protein
MPLRSIRIAATLVATLFGGVAVAADTTHPRGVVELFTSQGCSSCPPADALFEAMAQRDDMVALSYHVTYWDYLGWRDTLGSKENTERQYSYMRTLGAGSVYTPQVVVNGQVHVNGANRAAIDDTIDETPNGLPIGIKVKSAGDTIVIETEAAKRPVEKAHVVLVYFESPKQIDIGRGENNGRKMTYWNAVTGRQTAGMWHGKAERYELPASEISRKGGCAVLLQAVAKDGGPGPILGAAVVRKPAT